jgi:hypothetical protein
MLTLLAVFKDLLPAYRIHSKTREELPHKVCHVFHNLGLKAVELLRKRGPAGDQGRGTAAALRGCPAPGISFILKAPIPREHMACQCSIRFIHALPD